MSSLPVAGLSKSSPTTLSLSSFPVWMIFMNKKKAHPTSCLVFYHCIWRGGEVGILHRNDLSHGQTQFGCEVSRWQDFQNHHRQRYHYHPSQCVWSLWRRKKLTQTIERKYVTQLVVWSGWIWRLREGVVGILIAYEWSFTRPDTIWKSHSCLWYSFKNHRQHHYRHRPFHV